MNNKERVEEYQTQVWTHQNSDIVFDFFAPDAIIHSSVKKLNGPTAMKEIIEVWLKGVPDIKVYWDAILPEGDKVVSIWHCEGTQTGEFLGLPPSGNKLEYKGITVYEFKDGLIQEYWGIVDIENIKAQCLTS